MSARALEFTILTAVRTSEAIGATWNEIDMDAGVWTIPAARMKAKRDHRVPLSGRAVEILRNAARERPARSWHFVFLNGGGKPLSNQAMLELLQGHGAQSVPRFTVSVLPSQIGRVTALPIRET